MLLENSAKRSAPQSRLSSLGAFAIRNERSITRERRLPQECNIGSFCRGIARGKPDPSVSSAVFHPERADRGCDLDFRIGCKSPGNARKDAVVEWQSTAAGQSNSR